MKKIIIFDDYFIHFWNYNFFKNQFRIINYIETKLKNIEFIVINEDKDLVAIYSSNKLKIFNLENSEYLSLAGHENEIKYLLSIKTLKREMLISVEEIV